MLICNLSFSTSAMFLKFICVDKSSVLAWRIPGMEEPGGLPSMGSHRVGHDWSDLAAAAAADFMVQLSHPYMTTGKTIALTRWIFSAISLFFNILSRFVIAFLCQAYFNFMAAVTICSDFGAEENKVSHCFHCFPVYLPWTDGIGWSSFFERWVLIQLFHFLLSLSSRGSLVPLHFLA